MNWKVFGIIFLILFLCENALIIYGWYLMDKEDKQLKECYYDICDGYEEAEVSEGVCFCYEKDMLGDYVIAKTEVLK